ncbi:hypothetical protein CXB51_013739 [Gossypium anomalum]|uniref:Reverse transcriptase Ty1/copia-type domain-containing protein n=1 Tax=Gossypium anomalum TaxID=47600 RepID=A0A8J6D467_9ROSI|nr:hypothetical protein CXB51_013739 [Gossypium anomalum]
MPGCDFKETFSPVVKPATIQTILSVTVSNGWQLRQVDVKNTFLNEDLIDKVFMQQPPGYVQYGHNGIVASRSSSGNIHLCQRKYIWDLLNKSSLANAKSVHTLMVNLSTLSKDEGDQLVDLVEYRSLVRALQYMVLTWPDIAYAINRVCQFMHAPTTAHMVVLKCILRYLHGTITYGLVFRWSDKLSLFGYANVNWGLDFDDRYSTTSYCVYFGHTLVSWCSKKQQVVSRSTVKAKYRSLVAATSDIAWLVSLLMELKLSFDNPPTV